MKKRVLERFGILNLGSIILICSLAVGQTLAATNEFMYQGRIRNSDGRPLEYSSVSFEFTVLSADGTCSVYREQVNNVDMSGSNGIFDTAIGTGTKTFPASVSFKLKDAFNNDSTVPLSCSGGGTYTPNPGDGRQLQVRFYDGVAWRHVTPNSFIRSVPFATYADSARQLGTKTENDFVPRPTSCSSGQVITFDGTQFGCSTVSGGSGISALTGDVTASGTGAVSATISAGAVTTSKIADGNVTGVKLENSGVTAGTYGSASLIPSITVDAKGRVTSVSTNAVSASGSLPAASGASGKYLKSDGTNWAGSDVLYTDIKNAGGLAAFVGSACAANQALGWSSVTDSFVCQAIGSLNASAITAGTVATARLGSGTADNTTYLRGDGTWATVSTADATKLPLAGGTMAGTINMNGNQITNIGNVPFVATNPAAGQDGQTLRWNNTAGQWEWFTPGAAGAGIATINGLSGSAQTLSPSSSATTYGFSSAGSTHTLSIPSASTAGVTAGTISKTEYDAFNAKQAAGNYITTMTGDVTSSGFTAGSVTTTIANNAVTTAKIIDGAVTTNKIADGNVTGVKLENSGVTAGTYPKVTVDAKGRVTVGASLSASDIPNLDAAKITSGVLAPARLGTGTADNTTYLRGDGTWSTVASSGGTVTSITAGTGLTGGTITGSGTIGLGTELSGVNSLSTTGFVRRTGAGTYDTSSSVDLASQITGTLPVANGGTGATTAAGALTNLLPTQTGNNGKVLQTDGANVTWTTPAASGISALTGDVTASGTGSVAATIANNAVTSAKIANATIVGADLDFSGVNSSTTNFVMKDNTGKFYDFACSTTGHVPTWTVSGFACQAPSVTETDPKVGANTTNYVSKWSGSALVASGIIEDGSGNVGIGTSSPGRPLHVAGSMRLAPGALPSSPAAGDISIDSGDSNKLKYFDGSGWTQATGANSLSGLSDVKVNFANGNLLLWPGGTPPTPGSGQNVALGRNTLSTITSGSNNTAIGDSAAYTITTGYDNVAIGSEALNAVQTGSENIAIGRSAARDAVSSAFGNLVIGKLAGRYISGNSNIILGSDAGGDSVNRPGNSNILIGSNTQVPSVGRNSFLNIGNSIYGDLTNGNIGIGAVSPGAKLEVAGQIKITGGTPGLGKVLTSDANGLATWEIVSAGGSGTVTSITAGTGLTGGTITGSGTIGLDTELAGLNALSSTGYVKRTAAGTFSTPAISLATDITGTLPIANGGTGATTAAAALTNLLPTQSGNNGKVLQTDGNSATWVTPASSGITALTGDVTASGTGSVAATIANNAVTSAKIANATIVGADMDFTGVNTATTNFVMKDSTGKFFDFACSTTGHVPTWTVAGFACQAPSATESDPEVGANTTNYISKWNGSALVASGIFENSGNVGIGTATPGSNTKLYVQGQMASSSGTNADGQINFSAGNSITSSFDCGSSLALANVRNGGTYILVITGTGTSTCAFPSSTTGDDAASVTYKWQSPNANRTASSHTMYTLVRIGNVIYVSWATGFQ